jgi:hypothetical protein
MPSRRQFLTAGISGVLSNALGGYATTTRSEWTDLDNTGQRDCAGQINALLRQSRRVELPLGRYRIESMPLILQDDSELTGVSGAVLVKASAPDVPLLWGRSTRNASIRRLKLVNIYRAERHIVLPPGKNRFQLDLPLPWEQPSITIMQTDAGRSHALQYSTDFKMHKELDKLVIELRTTGNNSADTSLTYFVQPGLAPLIALEDTLRIAIEDVVCEDGAIAYVGGDITDTALLIRNCRLSNGQIRVEGRSNKIPPLLDERVVDPSVRGPHGIQIIDNRISGALTPTTERRYIKFTERVHGIQISGGVGGLQIVGNKVTGVPGDGIWLQYAVGGVVEKNHVIGNGLSGIGLENTLTATSHDLEIRNNIASGNWFDGCDFNFGNPASKTRSQLLAPRRGEYAGIRVIGNEFLGNGQDMPEASGGCGIFARWVRDAVLQDNRCRDNNLNGIMAELCSGLSIIGNTVDKNGRTKRTDGRVAYGIGLFGCAHMKISDNHYSVVAPQLREIVRAPWKGAAKDGQVEVSAE